MWELGDYKFKALFRDLHRGGVGNGTSMYGDGLDSAGGMRPWKSIYRKEGRSGIVTTEEKRAEL